MEKDHGFVNQYVMLEQLAALGVQTHLKLTSMKVFVHGITGIGVETVKNLAMVGVKSVTLYDSSLVTFEDIGRNFTCRKEHVGKMTRAEACHLYFDSFRSYSSVNVSKDQTIQHISNSFDMVVCVDNYDKNYLIKLNEACRKNNIGFIVSGSLGLYGYMFVDFGQNHTVFNQNGKQPVIQYIDSVKQTESQTQIFYGQYVSWQKQPFKKGDLIELMQFKGMESIKGQIFKVRQVSNESHSLKIDGTLKYGNYEHSGIVRQVKVPKKIRFDSFRETLEHLEEKYQSSSQTNNSNRIVTQYQLHLALNGLYEFYAKHNRLPKRLNQQQIDEVVRSILALGFIWKERKIEQTDLDRSLIRNVAKYAQTQISPMSKFWGGIVSHEIIKWTGIFSPFHQWFHHEFYDTLPEQNQIARTLIPEGRYNDYIQLFGDNFARKLQSSKSLLIGAGSLGNEFVEMLAMMGVSSKEGKIIVLDDGDIQQRNLSSHSLFREQHLMTKKSKSLCIEGSKINKQTNFEAIEAKFIDRYEDYFDDDFWQYVDFIINTPDSSKQKNYVDKVCVWYEKLSIQFETGNNKFNSFVIIPFESQNFSQYTLQIKYCYEYSTLNHFPFITNHAIQYSKNCFQDRFQQLSKQLNQFYKQPDKFIMLQIESNLKAYRSHQSLIKKMVRLKRFVEINQTRSFQGCVKTLLEMFIDQFDESMKQRLRAYPPDYVTENGRLFWCFRKRLPRPIGFQIDDPLHYQFVYHGSWILADIFGIRAENEKEKVKQIIAQVLENIRENVKIPKKNLSEQQEVQQCMKLIAQMKLLKLDKEKTPKQIVLDFTNPKNHQIQFLTVFTNLRAKNFTIEGASKLKVMTYASSLIPKLPTITSTLVGSAGIQLIKMILKKPRQVHKNSSISLSEPFISFVTPQPPKLITDAQFDPIMCGPVRALPKPHTYWDKLDIKGPMCVIQFKQHLQNLLKITVEMIYIEGKEIVNFFPFVSFHKKAAQRKRLMMAVEYAVEDAVKIPVYKWKRAIQLCICAVDRDGVDVCLPNVRYYFNGK